MFVQMHSLTFLNWQIFILSTLLSLCHFPELLIVQQSILTHPICNVMTPVELSNKKNVTLRTLNILKILCCPLMKIKNMFLHFFFLAVFICCHKHLDGPDELVAQLVLLYHDANLMIAF